MDGDHEAEGEEDEKADIDKEWTVEEADDDIEKAKAEGRRRNRRGMRTGDWTVEETDGDIE